jgi:DNA-directed RNA polymerase specialized sigma24 family protein
MEKGDCNIDIMRAAEEGAKTISDRPELIIEAKSWAILLWQRRTAAGNPPDDPKQWIFICAKRRALELIKKDAKFVDLSETIADTFTDNGRGAAAIERFDVPINWLRSAEAIKAIATLMHITADAIRRTGDDTDLRIFELHYGDHWTFDRIAREIGITAAAARQRWARLLWKIIDEIIVAVKEDQNLTMIFSSILDDRSEFRCHILALIGIIAARGMASVAEIIESMLPS